MRLTITDVLDKCIEALRQGKTEADCLASYPDAAPELLPLIQTAAALRQMPRAQASPAAMSAGKAAFLQEAARLRQAQLQRPAKPWQRLAIIASASFALPRQRSLAWTPALSVLLALALVFGSATTAIAAGRSLPDEPLYPVKLAGEQVQTALTTDPVARADRALVLTQKRLDEIATLASLGRPVSAPSIERLTAESTSALASISQISDDVMAQRLERYLALVAQQQALLSQVPSMPSVAEAINAALTVAEENKTLATTAINDPSALRDAPPRSGRAVVAAPKDTPAPPATPEARQMRTPVPTQPPAPTATATQPPAPTNTATPPPAPTNTATALPPSATPAAPATASATALPVVEFGGVIERIAAGEWVIAGRTVGIDGRTKIDGAPARPGARADVRASVGASGRLLALSITVHAASEQPAPITSVRGVIFAISGPQWNIGGQTVTVNPGTPINGAPAIGSIAEASGVRRNDALVAASITIVGPAPAAQLSGRIDRISTQAWLIDGQTVQVVPGFTSVSGTAEVGKHASVAAVRQDDGSLVARQITIVAPAIEEEFEGVINRMDGNAWTVSGRRVLRNEGTTVDETLGKAQVGQRVRVRGVLQGDGSVLAITIRVLAAGGSGHLASPTVTSTATPAVTATTAPRTPVAPPPTPPAVPSPTAPTSPLATPTPTVTTTAPAPTATASPATPSPTATATRQAPSPTATPGLPGRTRTPINDR